MLVATAQGWVSLLLGVAALGLEVFALIDALRRQPEAFIAADKKTKLFWSLVLGVAAAVGFITVFNPIGTIIGLIGVVAAGIYMADVRPALNQVTGRGRPQDGRYGPW